LRTSSVVYKRENKHRMRGSVRTLTKREGIVGENIGHCWKLYKENVGENRGDG